MDFSFFRKVFANSIHILSREISLSSSLSLMTILILFGFLGGFFGGVFWENMKDMTGKCQHLSPPPHSLMQTRGLSPDCGHFCKKDQVVEKKPFNFPQFCVTYAKKTPHRKIYEQTYILSCLTSPNQKKTFSVIFFSPCVVPHATIRKKLRPPPNHMKNGFKTAWGEPLSGGTTQTLAPFKLSQKIENPSPSHEQIRPSAQHSGRRSVVQKSSEKTPLYSSKSKSFFPFYTHERERIEPKGEKEVLGLGNRKEGSEG